MENAGKIVGGLIMVSRKSAFLLLVTAAGISAMLLVRDGGGRFAPAYSQSSDEQVLMNRDVRRQGHSPQIPGKFGVPADVFVDLASTSNPDGPVTILISVSSQVPVRSGIVRLKVPPIGEFPAGAEVVWSGAPADFVDETAEYTVDSLPAGKYRFIAIFEFTPDSKNTEKLFISKSLYLDIRPTMILSSNISFNQIKRVELWKELEQRILTDLQTGQSAVGPKTTVREIVTAENLDSGIIARRIAELKAADPDVARRIMELNRVTPAPAGTSGTEEISQKSQLDTQRRLTRGLPAFERSVPIPEKYRDR